MASGWCGLWGVWGVEGAEGGRKGADAFDVLRDQICFRDFHFHMMVDIFAVIEFLFIVVSIMVE